MCVPSPPTFQSVCAHVCVCVHVRGCRYPALQWQLRAARRALGAVAAAGPWLRDRVGLTRYAHVPLAGLGRDALMSIADVLLSRRLREAGHVLWTADPALPDLGERERQGRDGIGGGSFCLSHRALHQPRVISNHCQNDNYRPQSCLSRYTKLNPLLLGLISPDLVLPAHVPLFPAPSLLTPRRH